MDLSYLPYLPIVSGLNKDGFPLFSGVRANPDYREEDRRSFGSINIVMEDNVSMLSAIAEVTEPLEDFPIDKPESESKSLTFNFEGKIKEEEPHVAETLQLRKPFISKSFSDDRNSTTEISEISRDDESKHIESLVDELLMGVFEPKQSNIEISQKDLLSPTTEQETNLKEVGSNASLAGSDRVEPETVDVQEEVPPLQSTESEIESQVIEHQFESSVKKEFVEEDEDLNEVEKQVELVQQKQEVEKTTLDSLIRQLTNDEDQTGEKLEDEGELVLETEKEEEKIENIPQEEENIPQEVKNVPQEVGNIPQEEEKMPKEVENIPREVENIPQKEVENMSHEVKNDGFIEKLQAYLNHNKEVLAQAEKDVNEEKVEEDLEIQVKVEDLDQPSNIPDEFPQQTLQEFEPIHRKTSAIDDDCQIDKFQPKSREQSPTTIEPTYASILEQAFVKPLLKSATFDEDFLLDSFQPKSREQSPNATVDPLYQETLQRGYEMELRQKSEPILSQNEEKLVFEKSEKLSSEPILGQNEKEENIEVQNEENVDVQNEDEKKEEPTIKVQKEPVLDEKKEGNVILDEKLEENIETQKEEEKKENDVETQKEEEKKEENVEIQKEENIEVQNENVEVQKEEKMTLDEKKEEDVEVQKEEKEPILSENKEENVEVQKEQNVEIQKEDEKKEDNVEVQNEKLEENIEIKHEEKDPILDENKEENIEAQKEEPIIEIQNEKKEPILNENKEEPIIDIQNVETQKEDPKIEVQKEEPNIEVQNVEVQKEEPNIEVQNVEAQKEEPSIEVQKEEPNIEVQKEEPNIETQNFEVQKEEPNIEVQNVEAQNEEPIIVQDSIKNSQNEEEIKLILSQYGEIPQNEQPIIDSEAHMPIIQEEKSNLSQYDNLKNEESTEQQLQKLDPILTSNPDDRIRFNPQIRPFTKPDLNQVNPNAIDKQNCTMIHGGITHQGHELIFGLSLQQLSQEEDKPSKLEPKCETLEPTAAATSERKLEEAVELLNEERADGIPVELIREEEYHDVFETPRQSIDDDSREPPVHSLNTRTPAPFPKQQQQKQAETAVSVEKDGPNHYRQKEPIVDREEVQRRRSSVELPATPQSFKAFCAGGGPQLTSLRPQQLLDEQVQIPTLLNNQQQQRQQPTDHLTNGYRHPIEEPLEIRPVEFSLFQKSFHSATSPTLRLNSSSSNPASPNFGAQSKVNQLLDKVFDRLHQLKMTDPNKYENIVERLHALEKEMVLQNTGVPPDPELTEIVGKILQNDYPHADLQIVVSTSRKTTSSTQFYETETPGMVGLAPDQLRELQQKLMTKISGVTDYGTALDSKEQPDSLKQRDANIEGWTTEDGKEAVTKKTIRQITTTHSDITGAGEHAPPKDQLIRLKVNRQVYDGQLDPSGHHIRLIPIQQVPVKYY